mmetsp:Transcript_14296/g.19408  ORF Transcript_14296/g.19408 Transcript_14296/m.19408 type:complete len:81 (-) Transcript_14296:856-1098(-)
MVLCEAMPADLLIEDVGELGQALQDELLYPVLRHEVEFEAQVDRHHELVADELLASLQLAEVLVEHFIDCGELAYVHFLL